MLTLIVGNKNYSSWSMRPWVLMRHFGIDFSERALQLGSAEFAAALAPLTPTRTVPVLIDGELVVGDSLAIVEYLAERHPQHAIWPAKVAARASARMLAATMHSSFGALRANMPMNIEADLAGRGWNLAVQRDLDRICALWQPALDASGGPFLFGEFCAADAFYAPVCSRLRTYAPALPDFAAAYVERVLALPAVEQWCAQARAEHVYLTDDEPYRRDPAEAAAH